MEKNIIKPLPKNIPGDVRLSLEKWDDYYQEILRNKTYEDEKKEYDRVYLKDTLDQIFEYYHLRKGDTYLEIGCGPMFLGQELAKRGLKVIGIDFSLSALIIAQKMLEENGIKDYLLIQADIRSMSLPEETVDLVYGGGVIEHFRDTGAVVAEMYRVLKKGGICFNTVPELNLGSLTYRQVWGNIPNFPVLKQIAEFIHIKLLRKRHMRFGYELSFGRRALKRIFQKCGFEKVVVGRFKCYLSFKYLKFSWLKTLAQKLSKLGLFNPMLFVVAKK